MILYSILYLLFLSYSLENDLLVSLHVSVTSIKFNLWDILWYTGCNQFVLIYKLRNTTSHTVAITAYFSTYMFLQKIHAKLMLCW